MAKYLIAAGGSGGHLFPAQQLAQMLLEKGECEILFAGYRLENSLFLQKENIPFIDIPASPLNRLKFPIAMIHGFFKSLKTILSFKPDVVVGFGSYHSFPLLFAAFILRKKLVLYEANCLFGKVNRFFAPFAKAVAVQFFHPKGTLVPLFPWISNREKWDPDRARKQYGLDPDRLTFLVFGGSQGAQFLNEQIPAALAQFPGKIQAIHFTGEGRDNPVRQAYQDLKIPAHVAPFEPNMAIAYAAASCAICRSGAGTLAELIRNQMPALLIPFPKASDDHQRINAEYLASRQAAHLLLQKDADPSRLSRAIEQLVQDREPKRLSLQKIDLQNKERGDFADLVRNIGEKA